MAKLFAIDDEVVWTFQYGGHTRYVPGIVRGFRDLPEEVDRRGRVVKKARTQAEIAVPVAAGRKKRFWAEQDALTLAQNFVSPQYRQFESTAGSPQKVEA